MKTRNLTLILLLSPPLLMVAQPVAPAFNTWGCCKERDAEILEIKYTLNFVWHHIYRLGISRSMRHCSNAQWRLWSITCGNVIKTAQMAGFYNGLIARILSHNRPHAFDATDKNYKGEWNRSLPTYRPNVSQMPLALCSHVQALVGWLLNYNRTNNGR